MNELPEKGRGAPLNERRPNDTNEVSSFTVGIDVNSDGGFENGHPVPIVDGVKATEFDQPEPVEVITPAMDRDRIGLRLFFKIIEEEAAHGTQPNMAQIFVTFVAAANLAGIPFASGSTRALAEKCAVSHEIISRRQQRIREALSRIGNRRAKTSA